MIKNIAVSVGIGRIIRYAASSSKFMYISSVSMGQHSWPVESREELLSDGVYRGCTGELFVNCELSKNARYFEDRPMVKFSKIWNINSRCSRWYCKTHEAIKEVYLVGPVWFKQVHTINEQTVVLYRDSLLYRQISCSCDPYQSIFTCNTFPPLSIWL